LIIGRRWDLKISLSRVNSFSTGPGLSSLFFEEKNDSAMLVTNDRIVGL
jgi:hypothetical protein